MKEIGGYIELDMYHLPMLHEDAIALNCGRNALAYLLKTREIKRIWIPKLICESVIDVCIRENVPYSFYSVGMDFLPAQDVQLDEGEWLYFINYYTQFDNQEILSFIERYQRIIVDQAHSYFQSPIHGVDTLYTCRKYFGVPDGAFLYTNTKLNKQIEQDVSFNRMHFLLGRFEGSASSFYREYVANNDLFAKEPIKRMSKLTWNLLHGIDYDWVRKKRESNYAYLHSKLKHINQLKLNKQSGTFMYPLMLENGMKIRKRLQERKIYIPLLWPETKENIGAGVERFLAEDILPLPIDQRYSTPDMDLIITELERAI